MNLIYQYWNGDMPPGAHYSSLLMREYAQRIGAAYRCDQNEHFMAEHSKYFDCLRPIYDMEFYVLYDRILFVDLDVFPVRGLIENVFDVPVKGIGMCEEPGQPDYREGRKKHINGDADKVWAKLVAERWGCHVPVDAKGRVRVFNSGVVMFTRDGISQAIDHFVPIDEYIEAVRQTRISSFYAIDQNYLHAMVHRAGVEFTEIPVEWNRQVHGLDGGGTYDERTPETKFVHIQLSGADHNDSAWHDRIVNCG